MPLGNRLPTLTRSAWGAWLLRSRYFRHNEGTTDRVIIEDVTFSADFVIEFDILIPSYGTGVVLGKYSDSISLIAHTGVNGGLRFRDNGSDSTDTGAGALRINILEKVKLVKVGTTISIYVNNVLKGSGTSNYPVSFDSLYTYNGGSYTLTGMVANLDMYDSSVLVRAYALDDNDNIVVNKAAILGSEIFTDTGNFTNATGSVSGNTIVLEATSVFGYYKIGDLGLAGKTFIINFTVENSIGDNVVINTFDVDGNHDDPLGSTRFGNGNHEVITHLANFDRFLIRLQNTGNEVTISNFSIREAEGYGTLINGTEDQWRLYQQQTTGEWVSQNLVVNGGFDTDLNGWSVTEPAGQTVEVDNGRLHIVTDGSGAGVLQTPLTSGRLFRVKLDYEAVSGILKYKAGGVDYPVETTQTIEADYIAGNSNLYLFRYSGAAEGYFDNVSVKEVINVA